MSPLSNDALKDVCRPVNFECLTPRAKKLVGDAPMSEWISLLTAHKKSTKHLLLNLSNLVKKGCWKDNECTNELIQQARAALAKMTLQPSELQKLKRTERVYAVAREELQTCRKLGTTVTSLEGAPKEVRRPKFTVVRFTQNNYPRIALLELLQKWRAQAKESLLLAKTLRKIELLPEKKKAQVAASQDVLYRISNKLPRHVGGMKEVYVAYDDKNVAQGMALCWAEGIEGYHLKYPVTAPDNLDVLSRGKIVTRGAVSAIVTKIAEDVLQKIKDDPKTTAPRLFCNPLDVAIPFYKKLGFVDPSNNISDSDSDVSSSSDSDSDVESSSSESESDSEWGIDELEMDEKALQALVKKGTEKVTGCTPALA